MDDRSLRTTASLMAIIFCYIQCPQLFIDHDGVGDGARNVDHGPHHVDEGIDSQDWPDEAER